MGKSSRRSNADLWPEDLGKVSLGKWHSKGDLTGVEEGRVEGKGVRNSEKRKLTLMRALRWNRVQSIQGTESKPAGREWLVGLNSMERNWEESDGEVPCQPQWGFHDTSPPSCVPSVTLTSTLTNRSPRQLLHYDVNKLKLCLATP